MKTINQELPHNKKLGTIFNNDINNILCALDGKNTTTDDYQRAVYAILDSKPGVLAQNVGLPDPVIYQSNVATTLSKYQVEVVKLTWPNEEENSAIREANALDSLFEAGTDPLTLTIEACSKRQIPIVVSYRMNSEDWYHNTWMLSDFGRAHPEWRIPHTEEEKMEYLKHNTPPPPEFSGSLNPAIPGIYEHRMNIFREVAANYDIDGIEFDFRRWYHMVSNPLVNYPILTQMVRDTRKMLNEIAHSKGRRKLFLGVRICPSLDDPLQWTEYLRGDISCKELGLDVKTWIKEELVDYVCPSLYWPRWPDLPKIRGFVELAKNADVGIYPTLFPLPKWLEEGPDKGPINLNDSQKLLRYKNEFCQLALKIYEDEADGISTYNWYFHLRKANVPHLWTEYYGYGPGGDAVQSYILSILRDPALIRSYLNEARVLPNETKR